MERLQFGGAAMTRRKAVHCAGYVVERGGFYLQGENGWGPLSHARVFADERAATLAAKPFAEFASVRMLVRRAGSSSTS